MAIAKPDTHEKSKPLILNVTFLTGTVYFQQTTPILIVSGFCVYSVASALFMFPAVYGYLSKALTIYSFERADGAGRAADLVIQTFVRFTSVALLPVIFCAGLLYMLVSRIKSDLQLGGAVVICIICTHL